LHSTPYEPWTPQRIIQQPPCSLPFIIIIINIIIIIIIIIFFFLTLPAQASQWAARVGFSSST
jgi:hypothetical protein